MSCKIEIKLHLIHTAIYCSSSNSVIVSSTITEFHLWIETTQLNYHNLSVGFSNTTFRFGCLLIILHHVAAVSESMHFAVLAIH